MSRPRNTLGKHALGCRQCTLLDFDPDIIAPTPELVSVQRTEVQAYWRRRLVARRPTAIAKAEAV